MPTLLNRAAQANRQAWDSYRRQRDDGLVAKHVDVAAEILAGKSELSHQQRQLVGDVDGKRLLDLGCGDGYELLEWARLGADVTGVDNSPRQIAAAERAAQQLGIRCQLVVADLLELPNELIQGEFDIVFSSWVTSWIGDLDRWFQSANLALRSDGVFVLSGGHPMSNFYRAQQQNNILRSRYEQEGPFVETSDSPDDWNPDGDRIQTVEWNHTLGSIVTGAAQSGFRITHLLENGDAEPKFGVKGCPLEFILRAIKLDSC